MSTIATLHDALHLLADVQKRILEAIDEHRDLEEAYEEVSEDLLIEEGEAEDSGLD